MLEALKYAREGYSIVLVGHKGHEEVVGTMGEAPENIVLINSREEFATTTEDVHFALPALLLSDLRRKQVQPTN
jgi:4-hydroxy-3-methylbut-2-enyl diphosphate reductase